MRMKIALAIAGLALMAAATSATADDLVTYELSLKGTVFTPAELKVPAGKPFIIKFSNTNAAAAELEAKDLQIEKVAAPNSDILVRVKAKDPGKYLFVDEYHEDVAKGFIVVE